MSERDRKKATLRDTAYAVSALLVVGAVLSGSGLVLARRHGHETAVLWLGFVTVTLWFAALMCLGLKALQVSKIQEPQRTQRRCVAGNAEYVAEYSRKSRIVAIGLAVAFGALTIAMALRSAPPAGTVISAGFACFFSWYALQLMLTRVRFTRGRIVARRPFLKEVSEPYSSVRELCSKRGTIEVWFFDGESLRLHSGLGDPEEIVAYLREHIPPSGIRRE